MGALAAALVRWASYLTVLGGKPARHSRAAIRLEPIHPMSICCTTSQQEGSAAVGVVATILVAGAAATQVAMPRHVVPKTAAALVAPPT